VGAWVEDLDPAGVRDRLVTASAIDHSTFHRWIRLASKTSMLAALLPGMVLPSRYWYRRLRRRADPEMSVLTSMVRPGSIAVDIGGNVGDYTFALARHARQVVTFEPLPECVRLLRAARLSNVLIHQVALSSEAGTMPLYIPRTEVGEEDTGRASFSKPSRPHRAVEVPVRRLDEMALRDVSVIKIDVEGHEQAVIQGAAETIRSESPVLLVEIEERHLSVPIESVFRTVEDLGYAGYFLSPGSGFRPLDEFSPSTHQRPFQNRDSDPSYVNDFFFVALEDPRRERFTENSV
jgi:FkbM family methyltransferase